MEERECNGRCGRNNEGRKGGEELERFMVVHRLLSVFLVSSLIVKSEGEEDSGTNGGGSFLGNA